MVLFGETTIPFRCPIEITFFKLKDLKDRFAARLIAIKRIYHLSLHKREIAFAPSAVNVEDSFPLSDFEELNRVKKIGLFEVSGKNECGEILTLSLVFLTGGADDKHNRQCHADSAPETD